MTSDEKEIKRKLRILKHTEHSGNIRKTCRYFGIARSLFYLWRNAYQEFGEKDSEGNDLFQNLIPNEHHLR